MHESFRHETGTGGDRRCSRHSWTAERKTIESEGGAGASTIISTSSERIGDGIARKIGSSCSSGAPVSDGRRTAKSSVQQLVSSPLEGVPIEIVEWMTEFARERRRVDQVFVGFFPLAFLRTMIHSIAMEGDHQNVFRHVEDNRRFAAANFRR